MWNQFNAIYSDFPAMKMLKSTLYGCMHMSWVIVNNHLFSGKLDCLFLFFFALEHRTKDQICSETRIGSFEKNAHPKTPEPQPMLELASRRPSFIALSKVSSGNNSESASQT